MTKQISSVVTLFFLISALVILLEGCSKEKEEAGAVQKKETTETVKDKSESKNFSAGAAAGKELFYMKSGSNNISCADCHNDGTNSDNPLTKYFSDIRGADKRTSTYHGKFKGEDVKKHASGASVCWENYLKMKTPLTDEQINNLNEFYATLTSPDAKTEIVYETIALPSKNKAKLKEVQKVITGLNGDPVKGEEKFKLSCGTCHGENAKIKKVPDIFDEFEGNVKSIVFNVRFGDGAMPFYNEEKLSNQELADIAAYIMKRNEK
ncbi:MAG: Cytochrome c6 [Ignavibacteria bacterium]|nr:Cytochrome c6 [Ignavibacteria bacterium]